MTDAAVETETAMEVDEVRVVPTLVVGGYGESSRSRRSLDSAADEDPRAKTFIAATATANTTTSTTFNNNNSGCDEEAAATASTAGSIEKESSQKAQQQHATSATTTTKTRTAQYEPEDESATTVVDEFLEAGKAAAAAAATSAAATSTTRKQEQQSPATTARRSVETQKLLGSRGDWPHANTSANMTISHLAEESLPQSRAPSSNCSDRDLETMGMVVDMDTDPPSSSSMMHHARRRSSAEDSDDANIGPINLATSREEAINLTSRCNSNRTSSSSGGSSNITGTGNISNNHGPASLLQSTMMMGGSGSAQMSVKMRLKQKQRLEAVAKAASEMQQQQHRNNSSTTSNQQLVVAETGSNQFYDTHSALARLAEAAERKQEEEMMDLGGSEVACPTPPRGTTITLVSSSSSNIIPTNMKMPTTFQDSAAELANGSLSLTPTSASPQMGQSRFHAGGLTTPSPDSAIHSVASGCSHSPSQSPILQSRQLSGLSSPFSIRGTPSSLSRNNSDASQHGRSASPVGTGPPGSPMTTTFGGSSMPPASPQNSPMSNRHVIQGRQITLPSSPLPPSTIAQNNIKPITMYQGIVLSRNHHSEDVVANECSNISNEGPVTEVSSMTAPPGISRQQLINSPCPVCGDKISGFHYGIFSCESCKGFFKRTVQNKKNYQCLRGATCPISIATRKKCPACRFNKCLNTGMKLEAIREDRTRGGRSTYQCSYTLPSNIQPMTGISSSVMTGNPMTASSTRQDLDSPSRNPQIFAISSNEHAASASQINESQDTVISEEEANSDVPSNVPALIQEIMNVEHLWFSTRSAEKNVHNNTTSLDVTQSDLPEDNMIQTLTNMADKRLFKLVKWCKSLPLFKNILIDDQISLLINAWCELLVFSCCYRSIETPGIIRVSNEKSLNLETARSIGIDKWIEKMLNFTEQLRRLKVDHYEYVSMKVIVLLTSDASGLKEAENVRDSQEKVVQALQNYTSAQYPDMPSKFAELLLRMPELHRVCQGCKEMLCPRQAPNGGEAPGFNLLMELLRGDH